MTIDAAIYEKALALAMRRKIPLKDALALIQPTPAPAPVASAQAAPPPGPREPVGCRWIDGDPKRPGWRYCQDQAQPGSAYCADHHARAWRAA